MKKKTIDLSKQVISKFQALFVDNERNAMVDEWFLTTGRSGTKSSAIAILGNDEAVRNKNAVVFMRKNHNKLKNTVYAESKRAFGRMGLSLDRHTKTTKTPMQIHIKQTGSNIYFTGSDNPDDTKGMIDENMSIVLVVIDELTEFFSMGYDRGKEELENIKATFVRGNNEKFRMVYMFNPPKNPNHPVMKFLEEKKYIHNEEGERLGLNPKTRHIHATYLDTPVEWQGKKLIESAEETKRADINYYNWLWLGQCIGLDEVIYYMFDESKHVIKYEGQRLAHLGVGIDYGHMNATTFNAFGIDMPKKRIQGVGSWRHSGRETGKQKSVREYAEAFKVFVEDIENRTRQKVLFYAIDPSASALRIEIQQLMPRLTPIKANNDVMKGIGRVQSLKTYNALVYDPSQTGLISENKIYAWDTKSIEKGIERPIKDNDHDMDSERYYVMSVYKHMIGILPYLREGEK